MNEEKIFCTGGVNLEKIDYSDHFTCKKLLVWSLPAIGGILASGSFEVVDGLFISNYLGVDALVAIDMILPPFFIFFSIGLMFGAGTSALVAQHLGAGHKEKAKEALTSSILAMTVLGVIVALIGIWLMPFIARLGGVTDKNISNSVLYGRILISCLPFFFITAAFQELWITAGKAKLGFMISIIEGFLNIFFDLLFMGALGLGVAGAAWATVLAEVVCAVATLAYFCFPNDSELRFGRIGKFRVGELFEVCFNGISEMINEIAIELTTLLAYRQLMRYIGDNGVAAMGVFNTVMGIFMAVFLGVAGTVIPAAGYKYGENKEDEMKNLMSVITRLMLGCGVVMCILCFVFASPIAYSYFSYSLETYEVSVKVLHISALSCVLYGFNIVTAAAFTGMGDSIGSLILAAFDSLIAPVALIYLLPAVFGAEAIFWTLPLASVLTAILCMAFLKWRFPYLMERMRTEKSEE